MATYTLRVTQNEQTKTARINDNQSVKLAAEPNTEYQIYDEQGNLITHPTVERNGDDLWVYADHKKDGAPELILTNYYNQNPVLDADYVANAGHTLMTSDTVVAAAPILATEIIGKTLMAGAALVIGGTAWAALRDDDDPIPTPAQNTPNNQTPSQDTNNTPADNNQGNNPNNQGSSPTNPTDPNNANNNNNNQNPTPSNPTPTTQLNPPEITVNPMTTVINSQTNPNGTTQISGTFNLNNENLDSETITVSINGGEPMTVPAANINKDQKTWSLDVPNADLIQQNGELPIVAKINIKKGNADASATDNNQTNPNSPTPQPTTITVDTSAGKPEITIDDFQDIRKDQANPANDEYIIQGKLNHIDADIDVKDIQISLGLKGLQQNHNPTKQIINEDGSVSTTVNAVSGASLGGNDMIQISADKKSWTASVPKDWVIQNLGENELTATLTVKDKHGNTARAEQPAMDKYTVTENGQPIQTSTLNPPTITIMPTIAPITQANRDGVTLLTGRVILNNENLDHYEVKVTLGNGKTYTAELSDDKSMWYTNVKNQDLVQKQSPDNPISATVIVSRNGETAQATNLDNGLHKNNINQYAVDTQITKPEITIEKIANIDTSNTQSEYKLSGKLNLNNDDVKEHTITLTINGQAITQPIQTNSDKTAWEVMVPKEVLTAKNGQNEVIVGVNVTDHVGNTSSSDAANAQYDVTTPVPALNTPYITVAPIEPINQTNQNGKTTLKGTLDLNNENLDSETVTVSINGGDPITVPATNISPDKKSWSLEVDNSVLIGNQNANHKILATVEIKKGNQEESNTNVLNDRDTDPKVNTDSFIADTKINTPSITIKDVPNIEQGKELNEYTLSGTLEKIDADATPTVTVSINGTPLTTTMNISADKSTWETKVSGKVLAQNVGDNQKVTATVRVTDAAGNTASAEKPAEDMYNVVAPKPVVPEVTIDNIPHDEISVTSLTNPSYTKTISGKLTGLPSNAEVEVTVAGKKQMVTKSGDTWSIKIPANELTEKGLKEVVATVKVTDASGKETVYTDTKSFFVITPSIAITSTIPTITSANLSGKTIISGTFDADGADRKVITINIGDAREQNFGSFTMPVYDDNSTVKTYSSNNSNLLQINDENKTWSIEVDNSVLAHMKDSSLSVQAQLDVFEIYTNANQSSEGTASTNTQAFYQSDVATSSPLSADAFNNLMNQDNHLMSLLSNMVNVANDDDQHVSGKDNIPDTFVFSQFLDAGMIAHIDNFNADEDKLQLNQDVFTALSGAMTDFADYVQYDAATGALSYDADGKGDGAAVQFAQLSKDLELDQSHFIIV